MLANILIALAVLALPIVVAAVLFERRGRSLRCSWCAKPYAYWWRSGSRCCREHRQILDRSIRQVIRDTVRRPPRVAPNRPQPPIGKRMR